MSNLTSLGLFAAKRAVQSAALKTAQQPRPTSSISALFPELNAQLKKMEELVRQAEKRAEMASANQFNSRPTPTTFNPNPARLGVGLFPTPRPAPRLTKGNVLEFIGNGPRRA